MTRGRRTGALVAVALLVLVLALGSAGARLGAAGAAPAGGTSSISDRHPDPGQVVTVQAAGLKPGQGGAIDYLPDAVRLGTFTVAADGTMRQDVRIPATTYDGAKQIVVTSLDATGRYAYLVNELTISGPAATANISDSTLVPNQTVHFSGSRWFVGSQLLIILFPEQITLVDTTIGADQRLEVDARLPSDLRNGRHGIEVAGRAAGGRAAFVKMYVSVSGGRGFLPEGSDPFAGADLNPTTTSLETTSTTSPSTTTSLRRSAAADVDSGGISTGALVLVGLAVLVLAGVVVTWLETTDGRAWRAKRRQRRRQRQHRGGSLLRRG